MSGRGQEFAGALGVCFFVALIGAWICTIGIGLKEHWWEQKRTIRGFLEGLALSLMIPAMVAVILTKIAYDDSCMYGTCRFWWQL